VLGVPYSEDEEAVQQVGIRVEESTDEPRSVVEPELDDSGFVDFAAAGTEISGDFRCADCGYGAVVHGALPRCPMCGGSVWENRGPRH
jgi:rubrerythrin